jgi:glutamine synthetase
MSWFESRDAIDTSFSRYTDFISPAYSVRHLELMGDVVRKITEYGAAMGFEMIQADYEDTGQLECNFMYDTCLATADRLVTYRQICVQVAGELGLVATFMPKPVAGVMGNGCHHHMSFWRGDENAFHDISSSKRQNLTQDGLHAIGGLLTHACGLSALLAPTVNSYKRNLSDPTWGYDNRMCAIRALDARIELRSADATCNPYLSHLGILAAVKDGLDKGIDPGPAQEGLMPEESSNGGPGFAPLPITLGDALEAFEADEVLTSALSPELAQLFVEIKRDEWMRFCAAVTDWDVNTYLNYLP